MLLLHKNIQKIFLLVILIAPSPSFFERVYADTLGQRETFFVNKEFDKYGRTTLAVTLRHVSDKAYFYVEDNYWNGIDAVRQNNIITNIVALASEFENSIYPKETQLWGSESNPGVDGDPRITLLLEEVVKGNGGYFDTSNGYPSYQATNSNGREMVVVSIESLTSSSNIDLAKVFLAHEFQHLISFNQKDFLKNISEEIWLNELRSEHSVSMIGYSEPYTNSNLKRRFDLFLENPSDSLVEWPNTLTDYAVVNAFGHYLAEQYGEKILSETLRNSKRVGIPSLNEYLALKGYSERFEDIFGYWMTANYLNDYSRDNRFGYSDQDLKYIHVTPQEQVYLSGSLSNISIPRNLKAWQPVWLEFNFNSYSGDPSKSVKLSLVGENNNLFSASYLVFYNDGTIQFGKFRSNQSNGSVYIISGGKPIQKIVVMPTNITKMNDFGKSEVGASLRIDLSLVEKKEAEAAIIQDGALIKRKGESEIYVVWGKYKRYLPAGVINLYGHLNLADAIGLEPEIFNSYTTTNYVKYVNDEKVYALWPDGTKHWLNITPQQWDASGRDWEAIFTINDLELNYYQAGLDIIR